MSFNGAYVDYPFGDDCLCVKVKSRIFAQLFKLKGKSMATFNCDMMSGEFYKRQYPEAVARGYHCPPVQQPYFITVDLELGVPEEVYRQMISGSYSYVVGKLTKKKVKELEEEQALKTKD